MNKSLAMIVCLGVLASTAGASLNETFAYPAGPLPGNGQGTPPFVSPWPWDQVGTYQGRLNCIGSQSINLASDFTRTGIPDGASLDGLSEGLPTHPQTTFQFDVKALIPTTYHFDWWSITAYTDTNYPLLEWTGTSDTLTLHTPHGLFTEVGLAPRFSPFQQHARVDIDFSTGGLSYAFAGVRPGSHPTFPPKPGSSNTIFSMGAYANCDDVFYDVSNAGSKIVKVEIVSWGLPGGGGGPAVEQLLPESVYVNDLMIDATGNFVPLPSRTPPSGFLIANAGGPYSIGPGVGVVLNAGGSLIEGSPGVSYRWDLDNDGIFEFDAGAQSSLALDAASVAALGLSPGLHYVSVRTADALGHVDTAYSPLTITPEPASLCLLALGGLAALRRTRK